jgi:hypothetical protein
MFALCLLVGCTTRYDAATTDTGATAATYTVVAAESTRGNISTVDFQNGDIVFRKGVGAKTRAIIYADTGGIYSHTGIVVSTPDGFKIIHITPGERKKGETVDRIRIENIEDFFSKNRAGHGAVYRLSANKSTAHTAAKHALRLLRNDILFDHNYKLDDTTTMYCTEFVYYVYKLSGKDITFGKRTTVNAPMYSGIYIFPSDIYENKELELIYKF